MIVDRYTKREICEADLPPQMDLGRFYLKETGKPPLDLTYSSLRTDKTIRQELLLDENRGVQDVLLDILRDTEKSPADIFAVAPLIRQVKNKLLLNEFEREVRDKLFHLEEIFRNPHSLLTRVDEKVPVARAKRITARSYRLLAAHTEDWQHKSIVSFRPNKLLHEELDETVDIFENQFAVHFVERCLVYFSARLKEVQDLDKFLENYKKLLSKRTGWWKKWNRNLTLIAKTYSDENYHNPDGVSEDYRSLSETEKELLTIYHRLSRLRQCDLFTAVNRRIKPAFHDTNVFTGHKHYRHVKDLWAVYQRKVGKELSPEEKAEREQEILRGLRTYACALIAYALTGDEYLKYSLAGAYNEFIGAREGFPEITMKADEVGIRLRVGSEITRFLVLGSCPDQCPYSPDTCVLYWQSSQAEGARSDSCIPVSPLDPDSVERVGKLIRGHILRNFALNFERVFEWAGNRRDFDDFEKMHSGYLELTDRKNLKFRFLKLPQGQFNDCENTQSAVRNCVALVNQHVAEMKQLLVCPVCGKRFFENARSDVSLFPSFRFDCKGCDTVFIRDHNKVRLSPCKEMQSGDFGMDCITIEVSKFTVANLAK